MKVWIVTSYGYEHTTILHVVDSEEKADALRSKYEELPDDDLGEVTDPIDHNGFSVTSWEVR